MWKLQWEDNDPHEVKSLEHLNELLDQVAAKHDESDPRLVQIEAPSKEILMVGLGGELSVLDYLTPDGWPAWHSVGDRDSEGTIPYYMGSHHSEMPRTYAIPRELARKAVEYFYRTRERSPDVMWEED